MNYSFVEIPLIFQPIQTLKSFEHDKWRLYHLNWLAHEDDIPKEKKTVKFLKFETR